MVSKTAVILAGGLGERLKPLTELMPKALAPVNGIPMLGILLNQLNELKFERIVVLSGYKSNLIVKYIESIPKINDVSVIVSPTEFTPAERLLDARKSIGDNFTLLYCDNYVPEFSKFENLTQESQCINMLIQKRDFGNVKRISGNKILYTDGERSVDFPYVELGYVRISGKAFFEVLAQEVNLQSTFRNLSSKGLVAATEIGKEDFVSISNLEKFNLQNQGRYKIILDRDGIINRKMKPREYLNCFEDFVPISENWDALKILSDLKFDFIVATNQPGIALGSVSIDFVQDFHEFLYSELMSFGINIYSFYVCQHHWEENCRCRKPQPGMLLKAMDDFDISPKKTMYIGDEEKDSAAAGNANIESLIINSDLSSHGDYINLLDAIPYIQSRFELH